MCQVAWFITERYDRVMPDFQHGFRPGRGTKTAWSLVLDQVVKAKYIYEFDIKAFFDRVDVSNTLEWMEESYGLPDWLSSQIGLMSLLPITSFKQKPGWSWESPTDQTLKPVIATVGWRDAFRLGVVADYLVDVRPQFLCLGQNSPGPLQNRGFPQGAAYSPFLAAFSLGERSPPEFARLLMYADDGLLYSNRPFQSSEVVE